MQRILSAMALVLLVTLAGCTGTSTSTTSTTRTGATATHTGTAATNTTAPAPVAPHLTLTADKVNGTAPLNLTFHVDATPAGNLTWRLAFGDGASANGTQLPADPKHGYKIGGNFSALLTVESGAHSYNATLKLTVHAPAGADYPKVFTFGASKAGCAGDAYGKVPGVPLNCVNFVGGPTSPQFDGFWQPLDARYLGKAFTSTIATSNPLPDSDCYFVAPDAKTTTGDCTNGGNPAAGTVPAGTAWMFIYPYAAPSDSIVVTFT